MSATIDCAVASGLLTKLANNTYRTEVAYPENLFDFANRLREEWEKELAREETK